MTDPLDDLLEAALIEHGNVLRGRKAVRTRADYDSNYRACFTKAENWLLRGQVQLVHVEENVRTLLGLFDEFKHASVPGCRRLVATAQKNEAVPQAFEEVKGREWLPHETWEMKHRPTERVAHLACPLILDMGQHLAAEIVQVEARLVGGGLQRLLLENATTFTGDTPRTILALPAGLDVLEGLTHVCKAAVWRAVGEAL